AVELDAVPGAGRADHEHGLGLDAPLLAGRPGGLMGGPALRRVAGGTRVGAGCGEAEERGEGGGVRVSVAHRITVRAWPARSTAASRSPPPSRSTARPPPATAARIPGRRRPSRNPPLARTCRGGGRRRWRRSARP